MARHWAGRFANINQRARLIVNPMIYRNGNLEARPTVSAPPSSEDFVSGQPMRPPVERALLAGAQARAALQRLLERR